MARPVPLVLVVTVLSLVYRDALLSVSASDCSSSSLVLKEDDVKDIGTRKNIPFVAGKWHGIYAYVKPSKLFEGVAARLDGNKTTHLVWFPLSFPEDHCLPQRGEWGKIDMKVAIRDDTVPGILEFKLWYGGCSKACYGRTVIEHKDNWNLTLVSYGKSEWSLKKPNDSCLKPLSKPPPRVFSPCRLPPALETLPATATIATSPEPPSTCTTTCPQPSTRTTTLMVTHVSALVVAMVGIVVAVVAMVVVLTWLRKLMTSDGEDQTPHM